MEQENIKKTQPLMKNLIGVTNTLEGLNSRINDTEECISDLKDRITEIVVHSFSRVWLFVTP